MYLSHVEFMPENRFPIQEGSANNKPFNWRHVSFTFAILKDYCGRGAEEGWGSGDLPQEKFLRTTPSRRLENALLEHRV